MLFSKIGMVGSLLLFCSVSVAHVHGEQKMVTQLTNPAGQVEVHMAWSRALPPVAVNGAAYFMLHNNGDKADRLVAITSPIARSIMIHKNITEEGRVSMQHVDSLVVKAGGMLVFKPGGYHVMLMGLTQPLVAGGSFPLTVTMEKAGDITINVSISPDQGTPVHNMKHHH